MITNPGAKEFKDFSGSEHYSDFRRTGNYLIFSTYQDADGYSYVALLLNFFKT